MARIWARQACASVVDRSALLLCASEQAERGRSADTRNGRWVSHKPGPSGGLRTILGMPQNFLVCDPEQVFLMPPDPRDWLQEGHLAWFVLASVEEMDLSVFYGSYRVDGWGRAAFEPSMMVVAAVVLLRDG